MASKPKEPKCFVLRLIGERQKVPAYVQSVGMAGVRITYSKDNARRFTGGLASVWGDICKDRFSTQNMIEKVAE